jgi:CopG family transcriptional regulator / antitoxin EndoAI
VIRPEGTQMPFLRSTTMVCTLKISSHTMSKRINIVLPEKTLAILDRVAPKGNRSQLISRAVLHYVESHGKEALRERLKREAIANADRDLEIAADWFSLEEEASAVEAVPKKPSRTPRRKVA